MNNTYNNIKILRLFSEHPKNADFMLHTHANTLEILIILRGCVEFRVEGSVYAPSPYDTLIVSNNEMHRILQLSDAPYERIVIQFPSSFFTSHGCPEYSNLFYGRKLGEGNLLSREATENTYYRDCIKRLMEYYKSKQNEILIESVLIELLHILNKCSKNTLSNTDSVNYRNKNIKDIISYINENLSSDLNLNLISNMFFINKSYLCRAFKQHTGYTLGQYITHKRILYVQQLYSENMSIYEASIKAGFKDYSNFYKMYKKETGNSPSSDLK